MIRQPPELHLQFDPIDIPMLAQRYGPAQDEAALEAGRRLRSGDCNRENVLTIFRWKTKGRGQSRLALNTDEEITDALRLATQAQTERMAMAVLLGLKGVDVPVASAVLTMIFPKRFTVIDFRALQALGTETADRSLGFYLTYLATCRRLASDNRVSLRDLDRALWQWSREQKTK